MRKPSVLIVASLLFCSPARAADTTKAIADGVTMITRTTATPNVIRTLKADLTAPGVHLGATTSVQRRRGTSSYAKLVGAAAATNADFFNYSTYGTSGLAAGGGARWTDTKDDGYNAALVFDDKQRVELHDGKTVTAFDPTWMKGVVSGHPQVINAGVVLATNSTAAACNTRNPRTAVGLSQDKKTLILMVVDGRSSTSAGMTCTEVAAQMKSFGAYDAINLDGGGSSTMYLRGTGIVNKPSDGAERTVANHLGIFAPRLGSVGAVHGTVFAAPDPKALLAGATVSIAGGGADTTDATGLYDLETVPGMFAVTAKKPGFTTKSINVTVGTGGDVKLDVGMIADPNADFDGDAVVDSKDNCAEVKNPEQLDGDKDSIGDACDMDDDGDNVADEDDNCPSVSNIDQADADSDGVGDACPPGPPAGPTGLSPDAGAASVDNAAAPSDSGCSVGSTRGRGTMLDVALIAAALLAARSRRRRTPMANEASTRPIASTFVGLESGAAEQPAPALARGTPREPTSSAVSSG